MAFTRFTVTLIADVDEAEIADNYKELITDIALSSHGVRVTKEANIKLVSLRCDIQPGGMTQEEYVAKVHAQVHKAREDDDEGGLGGANSLN